MNKREPSRPAAHVKSSQVNKPLSITDAFFQPLTTLFPPFPCLTCGFRLGPFHISCLGFPSPFPSPPSSPTPLNQDKSTPWNLARLATMEDRRPNLTLPLPIREPYEFQRPQTSLRSPSIRSPRFREDFDAPFSEAIMNASRTTLATDTISYPSTGTNSRTSIGDSERPSPLRLTHRNASWESETKRRARVNDRILEWAKRSWGAVRSRSNSNSNKGDYFDSQPAASQSSVATSPSADDIASTEPDSSQAANTVTNTQRLTSESK